MFALVPLLFASAGFHEVSLAERPSQQTAGRGRVQQPPPDPHKLAMFFCDWHESMPHQSHGGPIERDILTHGDPQISTKRCAVLAYANHVSYATLTARGGFTPMTLEGAPPSATAEIAWKPTSPSRSKASDAARNRAR
jgi:hypothetical protein